MSERAWYEKLMPERIRKTVVSVARMTPDKVPTYHVVENWPAENGQVPYTNIKGHILTIGHEPAEDFTEVFNLTETISEWLKQFDGCPRVRVTLRFNEFLELRALSQAEYDEELHIEDAHKAVLMREKREERIKTEQERARSEEKGCGKKAAYDWSKLDEYLAQDMTLREIADKIGCSVAGVRHQVKKRSK